MGTNLIAENVAEIRERIARAAARVGRPAEEITLVGISKTFSAVHIRAAYEAGVRHFGENRVQEWERKRAQVADLAATWHLVGHLQSNKAARAALLFHRIDSVDRIELAQKLDRQSGNRTLGVLIELRLAPEETKSGVEENDLPDLAGAIVDLPHLEMRGLMCIPPFEEDPENARPYFRRLREVRDSLAAKLGRPLPVLSMGMSHDFEIAIEEGATEVRVGTALFGARGNASAS
jgi:pyridoxal phosphate enzyme (YggS family)